MHIRIIAAVAAAFTAAISSAALAGDAGVVETVAETAYGTAPSQTRMEKHAGDVVQHRELLETSKSGAMKVRFADGSKLALGATVDTSAGEGYWISAGMSSAYPRRCSARNNRSASISGVPQP